MDELQLLAIKEYLIDLLYVIPVIVISFTVHEYSHAWMAQKLGDPTPREEGRLSLNPLRHFDVVGFIVLILLRYGWGKPVRVNPMYFKDPRKGMVYTAIAGPISNICLGVVSSLVLFFSTLYAWPIFFINFFTYMVLINIGLAIFNLIPIAPLDGSRVVSYFSPRYATFMAQHGNMVHVIFIALLILPNYLNIPDIFGFIIGGARMLITSLLMGLWSLIFGFLI